MSVAGTMWTCPEGHTTKQPPSTVRRGRRCWKCDAARDPEGVRRRTRESAQRRRNRRRAAAIARYGGECACCGEEEPSFLAIDHINGGGNKHREEIDPGRARGGSWFYAWLEKNGYPDGFRVLCHNCNHSTHVNGGRCAHAGLDG